MATVYDPEKQGEQGYHPPNLDPHDNQPAGDSSDPRTIHKNPAQPSENDADDRDSLRSKEPDGGASTGTSGGGNFKFNPKGDHGAVGASGLSAGEKMAGLASGFGGGATAATTVAAGAKNFFFGSKNRKRNTAIGGATGTLIGGSVFVLLIVSGPAQLVQLSQLLQHNFSVSQSDSESRTNSLLRSYKAYKTGDYRYSRVGLIGQRSMAKIVAEFNDAGIEFTGSDVLGRPTGVQVDRSVFEEKFPETKGMNDAEFNDFVSGKFGVDPNSSLGAKTIEAGKSSSLDINGVSDKSITGIINNGSTQILGNSKVVTAIKTRNLKQFFGIDNLFHWFSRAVSDKIRAKAADIQKNNPKESEGEAENEATSQVADSEFSDSVSPVEEPGKAAFTQAHDKANNEETNVAGKILPAAGVLYAGGCTLNGLSDAIVVMNRSLIVLPAAVEAAQLVGMGSQIQNGGNDITMDQVGATVKGLTNSQGQTIWSGAALQATEGANKADSLPKNSNGQIENDLPGEYKQAFGTDTTSSNLKTASNIMLSWFPLHYISGVIPGGQCGVIGGATIIVAGVAAQAVSAIANAEDGEAGDIALNAALDAAGQNISQGIQGKLLGPFISNFIERIAKATVAPALTRESFSGPIGGNLIAYGARAAANSAAILNGGLALGNNASTIIGSAGQEQQQQFRSENFFARMFDVNDYRSLSGHLAADISPSVGTNLQLGINNTFNIGGILTSVFGNLIPRVAAGGISDSWTGNYDWGFPQYAIPDNMLKDPALSDPYQNAEDTGKYLSSVCNDGKGNIGPDKGDCNGSNGYTARIMACFGDNLTYTEDSDVGGQVWDVEHAATAANSDVNPVSDAYLGANCGGICPDTIADCGNSSEEQWEKIVMFVNDAFNIKGLDCAGGYTSTSDQSCQDVGQDQSGDGSTATSSAPAATNTGTGTLPTGSSQDLAKQLLPFIQSGKLFCGPAAGGSGAADCTDIQNTAKGVPVGGECQVNAITPHLLGLILGLVRDDGWTLGISAMCGDHHVEADGPYGGHSSGTAADFAVQNGKAGLSAATDEQFVNDAAALLSTTGGSFGQVAVGPGNTPIPVDIPAGACHSTYDAQKANNFTLFEDSCTHQHVRAAP